MRKGPDSPPGRLHRAPRGSPASLSRRERHSPDSKHKLQIKCWPETLYRIAIRSFHSVMQLEVSIDSACLSTLNRTCRFSRSQAPRKEVTELLKSAMNCHTSCEALLTGWRMACRVLRLSLPHSHPLYLSAAMILQVVEVHVSNEYYPRDQRTLKVVRPRAEHGFI